MTSADQVVLVTLTRTEFAALGVEQGSPVYLRLAHGAPTVPVQTPVAALDEPDPVPA